MGCFPTTCPAPSSLLTLLVPNEQMPVGLLFLAVLKIALAGLAFCLLIRRRYPLGDGAAVFASVCYALMSYNMIYSICVMWLDGVIWLPCSCWPWSGFWRAGGRGHSLWPWPCALCPPGTSPT